MGRFGRAILAFGLVAGASALGQEPQAEKGKIQGTWKLVSFEAAGANELLPPDALKKARVLITADKLTFDLMGGGKPLEAHYTLDPSNKPKAIDLVDLESKERKPLPGIYQVDGDDLKLCWDANGQSRPSEFTKVSKRGQDLRLVILKRVKK
jgi:uncharacterized protein (TIGR03067 family)